MLPIANPIIGATLPLISLIFPVASTINYSLVKFSDGNTSVIPTTRIDDYFDVDGNHCTVKWTNKKSYEALILFSGFH